MLLLIIFIAVLLCSCTKEERLTLAVGGTPEEVLKWEKLVDEFEETYQIKVEVLRQPADTDLRRQSLVVALTSKSPDPDVFLMDVAWISQFLESNWLYEIRDVDTSNFFPVSLQAGLKNGKVYALPLFVDCGVLYYRKDLLDKYECPVPETWDQLLKCSLKVMKEEGENFYGFLWQGAQYEGLVCTFLEFSASAGGSLDQLDSPQNLKALRFMRDLIHKYRVSPPSTYTEMKEEEVRILFQSGRALFARNWPYAWALHNSEDSPVRGTVGVAPLPGFRRGTGASCLGGWHLGISRFSDRKDDSLKLVKFLISEKIQKRIASLMGWNPARTDVYRDLTKSMKHLSAVKRACLKAVQRPAEPYYSQISEIIRLFVNGAISGRVDPSEALKKAENRIERLKGYYR